MTSLNQVDKRTEAIGSANTVLIRNGLLKGTNTDGSGTMDAIEKLTTLHNKNVLIIGAGGAARPIAYEAAQKGPAFLCIANRTLDKAKRIANNNAVAIELKQLPHQKIRYDIVINTIPNEPGNALNLIDNIAPLLHEKMCFMNIDYAHHSQELERLIEEKGCYYIPAKALFTNQARRQLHFWFEDGSETVYPKGH